MSIADIQTGDKVAVVGSWKSYKVRVTPKFIRTSDGRKFHRDTGDEAKRNWASLRDRITPITAEVAPLVEEAEARRAADRAQYDQGWNAYLFGMSLSECTTPMQKRGWAMAQVEDRKVQREYWAFAPTLERNVLDAVNGVAA